MSETPPPVPATPAPGVPDRGDHAGGAHPARSAGGHSLHDRGGGRQEPGGARRLLAPRLRRVDVAVALLLALLGFAAVVQVRSTQEEGPLAAARQEDLVQILDDLSNRDQRLRAEVAALEQTQRQLTTGTGRTSAALEEARRRTQLLGVLAGTVPATGPGIRLTMTDPDFALTADVLLDALQELRAAGAEAVQLEGRRGGGDGGGEGRQVRVVAGTSLVQSDEVGIVVDGEHLLPPYRFLVIGDPATLVSAVRIPGGVVDNVEQFGGRAIVERSEAVQVTALRRLEPPRYARPTP